MKFLITHILSNEERKEYENLGLFCYDLRDSDFGNDIATIEKRVLVNRIGSAITDKEIEMEKVDSYMEFVDYNTFAKENECVDTIEELLDKEEKTQDKNKITTEKNKISKKREER